jgi:hypothetical protein
MTEATSADKKADADLEGLSTASLEPVTLAGPKRRHQASGIPAGLMAGLVGAAAIVLLIGVVMWQLGSSRGGGPQAGLTAPPPPPTESDGAPPGAKPLPGTPSRSVPSSPPQKTPPGSGSLFKEGPRLPTSPTIVPQLPNPSSAEVWPLPPVSSSEPEVLATVEGADAGWSVTVRSTAADLRVGMAILLEPEGEPGNWALKYGSGVSQAVGVAYSQGSGAKEVLARLHRQENNLTFAWAAAPSDPQVQRQVANCLVDITAGTTKRVGQLREPLDGKPIALDLTTDKQVVALQIPDPPKGDTVRFEISELRGFPSGANLRDGTKTATAASATALAPSPLFAPAGTKMPLAGAGPVIVFDEAPGAEIRVRLARAAGTGRLEVSLEPVYCEDQTVVCPLSLRELEELEEKENRDNRAAKRDLPVAEKKLDLAEKKLRDHEAKPPPAFDKKRKGNWDRELANLKRDVDQFTREAAPLKQAVEKSKARLEAIPKMQSLIKTLEIQAMIDYTVYSECGEPDLLLMDGREK